MYEHRSHPPLALRRFVLRMLRHFALAAALLVFSLWIGMAGYEHYEHLAWRDAFLNAAMLLGGMGPVNNPVTPAGKLFAGCYALYAGLIFIFTAGIILAPLVHRMLHLLHCEERK
jgi:glucose-6-phosphate-specific signal transduction histidine kinase